VDCTAFEVEVGSGVEVGVGWGMRSFCPTLRKPQSAGRLLSRTMLAIDTLNKPAILEHESLDLTTYSLGGSGVAVGTLVAVMVAVAVKVTVAVDVAVAVGVKSTTI